MPEGPEVLRITQRLDSGMANKTLNHIEFHVDSYRAKQFRGDPTAVSNFLSELSEGLEVNSVNCKGKFIWFDFGDYEVWHTLGMSGTWRNYWPKRGNVMLSFQFSLLTVLGKPPRYVSTKGLTVSRSKLPTK